MTGTTQQETKKQREAAEVPRQGLAWRADKIVRQVWLRVTRQLLQLTALAILQVGIVSASGAQSAADPVFQDSPLTGRGEGTQLAIYIEEGSIAPAQVLLKLPRPAKIKLVITDGPAEFLYRKSAHGGMKVLKVVTYRGAILKLPMLKTAGSGHDSHIQIIVDGQAHADSLRVATLQPGILDVFPMVGPMQSALLLLDLDKKYAMVDEAPVGDLYKFFSDLGPAARGMLRRS